MSGLAARRGGSDRRLFGEILLEAGLLNGAGLRAGLEAQRLGGGRLGCHLLRLGHVVPAALHSFLSENLESIRPDIVRDLHDGAAAGMLPARLAHHYGVAPVRSAGGVLDLAVSSADGWALKTAVEALTGLTVEPVICPPGMIAEALDRFYPGEVEPGVTFRSGGDHELTLADPHRDFGEASIANLPPGAPPSAWLRAIVTEALARPARRIEIVPHGDRMEVVLTGRDGRHPPLQVPRGPYAGVTALLDGLARIAARGRVLPRDGRFALLRPGRRTHVSVLALPGLRGHAYQLDLRDERIVPRPRTERVRQLPGLAEAAGRLSAEGRGLLLLAAPSDAERSAALEFLADLLGAPLAWPATSPGEGLVVITGSDGPVSALAALQQAGERVVVGAVEGQDAAAGLERAGRLGLLGGPSHLRPAGVLAARLLETLCHACAVGFDLAEVLPSAPRRQPAPRGPFWTAPGCSACRGSGTLGLELVCEFQPLAPAAFRPGGRAAALRRERLEQGGKTLFDHAVEAAAEARIDVKEALRLLHEQR